MRKSLIFFIVTSLIFSFTSIVNAQYQSEVDENFHRDYWPSGNLRSQEPLVNGVKHGLAEYYHDNSRLYSKIPWENGKKHGSFILYFDTGVIDQEMSYKSGKIDGLIKWYYPDGTLKTAVNYKGGKIHGNAKWFSAKGVLMDEVEYADDEIINTIVSSARSKGTYFWQDQDTIKILASTAYFLLFLIISIYGVKKKKKKQSDTRIKEMLAEQQIENNEMLVEQQPKKSILQNPYQVLILMRNGMIAAGFIMGAIAYFITEKIQIDPMLDHDQVRILQYSLVGAVILISLAISKINTWIQDAVTGEFINLQNEKQACDIGKIIALSIALLALGESLIILGFVATTLTANMNYFLALAIMGFYALMSNTPRRELFLDQHDSDKFGLY